MLSFNSHSAPYHQRSNSLPWTKGILTIELAEGEVRVAYEYQVFRNTLNVIAEMPESSEKPETVKEVITTGIQDQERKTVESIDFIKPF